MRYFSDKTTPIDYVLVYNKTKLSLKGITKLENFLKKIIDLGFKVEIERYSVKKNIYFVKVHAPNDIINEYAFVCDVDLACRSHDRRPFIQSYPNFMATPLTKPVPKDDVYKRAQESISLENPKNVTSAEKIMVMYRIMEKIKFYEGRSEYGLRKLIHDNVLCDAFPLHDGPYAWSQTGSLNDRQLLAKYWANFKSCYKVQPMNLIERYYGTEYAFYFAWFGFYTKMLIPIGLISLLCILFGIVTVKTDFNSKREFNFSSHAKKCFYSQSEEICTSNITMCARCHFSLCKFEKLRNACFLSHLTYLFDNHGGIFIAVITSFWSTAILAIWRRNEARLQIQWRVRNVQFEDSIRSEYAAKSKRMIYSPIRDCNEPYVPAKTQFGRFILSLASVILLVMIVILATIGVTVYRLALRRYLLKNSEDDASMKRAPLIATATGGLLTALLIGFTYLFIPRLSVALTNLENHRTQREYEAAFIFKYYAMSFANAYTTLFYIAFFKGHFFRHPGDVSQWREYGGIGSDVCGPSGCITTLVIQLISILVVKLIFKHLMQIFLPMIKIIHKKLKVRQKSLSFYEQEYLLNPIAYHSLHEQYLQMVLQYGYVVFFVAAFPPAPAIALINNLFEIRTDAGNYVKTHRRPVPDRVPGVGAWFQILKFVTYFGVVINAMIIGFTSDFVPREFRSTRDYSYVTSALSEFDMNDFIMFKSNVNNTCFYIGQRYPPSHPEKYQPTDEYWFILAMRFLVVLFIEHVVFILTGILAYAIPDVPSEVHQLLTVEEKKNKELRKSTYKQKYSEFE